MRRGYKLVVVVSDESTQNVPGSIHIRPHSINSLTTISFPPDDAACKGSTPSSTKLMGWPWEEGIFDELDITAEWSL